MKRRIFRIVSLCALVLILVACENDPIPKPIGYIRMDLPEHAYSEYQLNDILAFDLSDQAEIEILTDTKDMIRFNIVYPHNKAKIHMAYNKVNNNLSTYLEETRKLTYQHHQKANNIEKSKITDVNQHVFGINYNLSGNVASSSQFFLTDSTNHFLRGALYFWARPNEDSLAPATAYIRNDIEQIIETCRWIKP